jgi:DNA modification methylase
MLMDAVFGVKNFVNEVVWHYTGGGRSKTCFSRKHDIIFWYARTPGRQTFDVDAVRVPYKETSGYAKGGITSKAGKKYMPNPLGTPVDDVWDIPIINPMSHERLGYPTQKPMALLERIIRASCPPGGVVLSPFCGSGTALDAAQGLGHPWVGIDSSIIAIRMTEDRLRRRYPEGLSLEVNGLPQEPVG